MKLKPGSGAFMPSNQEMDPAYSTAHRAHTGQANKFRNIYTVPIIN